MKEQLDRVGLLIIGDEILQGRRVDKHFPRALEFFPARGVELAWIRYVGDELELLIEQFSSIRQRKDVCFSFGGIGATPDDLTRLAAARAFGRELERHPEALRLIENQFGQEAYPNRVLMADLPSGAELIPNGYNNIPGFFLDSTFCLPGFPEMAWPMLEWVVQTRFSVSRAPVRSFSTILVPDARESELIPVLEDVQRRFPEVKISSLPRFPEEGIWQVELGVRGTATTVEQAIEALRGKLNERGYLLR